VEQPRLFETRVRREVRREAVHSPQLPNRKSQAMEGKRGEGRKRGVWGQVRKNFPKTKVGWWVALDEKGEVDEVVGTEELGGLGIGLV